VREARGGSARRILKRDEVSWKGFFKSVIDESDQKKAHVLKGNTWA
jgi:hypothetical protein